MNKNADTHWSSDFVEHLRTVHFSLVVVAAGLIIVVSTQRDTATSRANAQLALVATVVDQLDPTWFTRHCKELKQKLVASHAGDKDFALDHGNLYIQTVGSDGTGVMVQDQCLVVGSDPTKKGSGSATIPMESRDHDFAFLGPTKVLERKQRPRTLSEFQEIWDALNSNPQVVVPLTLDHAILSRHPMIAPRAYEAVKQAGEGVAYTVMEFDRASPFDSDTSRTFVYRNDKDYIPVAQFDFAPFDGMTYLRSVVPSAMRTSLKSGVFADAFSELNELTKDRQAASFDVWTRALKAELERGGETFEAFGLRVPSEVVTIWGGVIILGVQIYFLSHLLQLTSRLRLGDPGLEVAWIAIYNGFLAKSMTFLSAVLLPPASLLLLAYKAEAVSGSMQTLVLGAVGVGISACLSLVSAMRLPQPLLSSRLMRQLVTASRRVVSSDGSHDDLA